MYNPSPGEIVVFIIICLFLVIFLLFIIGMVFFRYQKRQVLHKTNIKELEMKYENDVLQSRIEIQEQTFDNISREIHDNIGQKLTLAKLQLNRFVSENEEMKGSISDSILIIGEVIIDLSDISRSLSSDMIQNYGLLKAIEFEVSQLNKLGWCNFFLKVIGEIVFLDEKKELAIFRILQESLNNIIKHAQASEIEIMVNYSEKYFILSISDNGKGFNINNVRLGAKGLGNIRKRTETLEGNFTINSLLGQGTSIEIKIPIYGS